MKEPISLLSRIKASTAARWMRLRNRISQIGRKCRLDYHGAEIFIFADNGREMETRAKSCSKEPETVQWIEARCSADTIFYDIGANIGAYSLVAAAQKARVYAFEPAYQNYFRLCQNVSLNNMDEVISCFPVAFSSATAIKGFVYQDTTMGTSRCYFNKKDNFRFDSSQDVITKSTLIYCLDEFQAQFDMPCPHMLKIDVDGAEKEILEGARDILANPVLETILIEIDERIFRPKEILDILEGFHFFVEGRYRRDERTYNYILKRG